MQGTRVRSLGQEDTLEKEMATHSSILTWEIPWTEEPGARQPMESQKSQTRLSDWTTHAESLKLVPAQVSTQCFLVIIIYFIFKM